MSKLYVILARTGDVLGQLPILYDDFKKTGEKPMAMVAKEFAKVLDGCSYIEPIIFEGDYLNELDRAVKEAQALSDNVIVTSIHGTKEAVEKHVYSQVHSTGSVTSNFQLEQWNLAGRAAEFYENLPLVFDMRSSEREKRLLDASGILKMRKPIILLSLGGQTAPFPHADLLRDYVHAKFDKSHRVIDLPMTEDGHCFDLLAVMERAALLITTDSMPLHLAWACPKLPVFALTNDRDSKGNRSLWHGAPWRPNHLWYCRYHDWPARAVEMMQAIENLPTGEPLPIVEIVSAPNAAGISTPAQVVVTPGTSSRELHGMPFLKDLIRMGVQRCGLVEERFKAEKGKDLDCKMKLVRLSTISNSIHMEPTYAYRMQNGQYSPVADLFSAPKSFWRTILPEVPDLLLCNQDNFWGEALVALFRKHGASDQTGVCEFVG